MNDDDDDLLRTADGVDWWPIATDFMDIPEDFCLFGGRPPQVWIRLHSAEIRDGIYRNGGLAFDLRPFTKEELS